MNKGDIKKAVCTLVGEFGRFLYERYQRIGSRERDRVLTELGNRIHQEKEKETEYMETYFSKEPEDDGFSDLL